MKYLVRVSQLRYGTVEVEAKNEEEAKTLATGMSVDYFDEEITDMLVEKVGPDKVDQLESKRWRSCRKSSTVQWNWSSTASTTVLRWKNCPTAHISSKMAFRLVLF